MRFCRLDIRNAAEYVSLQIKWNDILTELLLIYFWKKHNNWSVKLIEPSEKYCMTVSWLCIISFSEKQRTLPPFHLNELFLMINFKFTQA